MQQSKCRSCDASIVWATVAESGKRMPLDAEPDPTGLVGIISEQPVKIVVHGQATLDDGVRYTSHFATCPDHNDWRHQ